LPLPADTPDAATTEADLACIRVPGTPARYELWTSRSEPTRALADAGLPERPASHWELQEILAGVGEVVSATREEFIPQMLNLQSLGGISFKKGCYTGQEIVARMQYLGTLKKRMYLAQSPGPAAAE